MEAGAVQVPGAFNALCAKAIAHAGFHACYVSGAATSVAAGVPDIGLLSLDHFARTIREVADASRLPVLADADTGFGESECVRRTVIEYARAGAAALHIEDQVFPKRCGHLDGKKLIPIDHQCEKIAAAVNAASDLSPDSGFIICARTDARSVEGLDAVVNRAHAYIQAGAHMIFPEGLQSEEEFTLIAQRLRPRGGTGRGASGELGPYLLANMTEFGKTPIIPFQRFAKMGYACVIYPVSMLRVAMGAVSRALSTLKHDGSVHRLLDDMQSRDELYTLIGYTPGKEWDFPAP